MVSVIEDDYTGPKLEDGKVTLQFMKDLMTTYKAQGKLHRKYAYEVIAIKYQTPETKIKNLTKSSLRT